MRTRASSSIIVVTFLGACASPPPPRPVVAPVAPPVSAPSPPVSALPPSSAASPPSPAGAPAAAIVNAEGAVGLLRVGFKKCYLQALDKDPKVAGHVSLTVIIDASGAVVDTHPAGTPTLPDDLVACLMARARQAVFASPGPNGSTIQIPITFKQDRT